jgi:hypothetical protein
MNKRVMQTAALNVDEFAGFGLLRRSRSVPVVRLVALVVVTGLAHCQRCARTQRAVAGVLGAIVAGVGCCVVRPRSARGS